MDYKGHRLQAQSYENQATRRWVPKITITWHSGPGIEGRALTATDHEQDTKKAADGYALEMGKQWVDRKRLTAQSQAVDGGRQLPGIQSARLRAHDHRHPA